MLFPSLTIISLTERQTISETILLLICLMLMLVWAKSLCSLLYY